jgi:hypothetical protein
MKCTAINTSAARDHQLTANNCGRLAGLAPPDQRAVPERLLFNKSVHRTYLPQTGRYRTADGKIKSLFVRSPQP